MFRTGLLLIIRRYYSVYTATAICRAFMLNGCWYDSSRSCQQPRVDRCTSQAVSLLGPAPTLSLFLRLAQSILESNLSPYQYPNILNHSYPPVKMGQQKCWHITFRRRVNTQKKSYSTS